MCLGRELALGAIAVALLACGGRPPADSPLPFTPMYLGPDQPISGPAVVPGAHAQPNRSTAPATPDTKPVAHQAPAPAQNPDPDDGTRDGTAAPVPTKPGPPTKPSAFNLPVSRGMPKTAPAWRIANLSSNACRAELNRRALPVAKVDKAQRGVGFPLRLKGPLRGVTFLAHPAPSPYGIFDCRLVLIADEFAAVLAAHGVAKIRLDNTYRPGARIGGRGKASQHSHALAMDIMRIQFRDGVTLKVTTDWAGERGEPVCGPDARIPANTPPPLRRSSLRLRNLVCDVARRGLFNTMLTPNYNAAHRSHFHFDIKSDTTYRAVR